MQLKIINWLYNMQQTNSLITEIDINISDIFEHKITILLHELVYIFGEIYKYNKLDDVKSYFEVLYEIHNIISSVIEKYKVKLQNTRLEKFIAECSNLNLEDKQIWLFNKIKYENYLGY